MENTKMAEMKQKYLELGKKLGLKDDFLKTIGKELKTEETPGILEIKIEKKEEGKKEEVPCEYSSNPLIAMLKSKLH